MRSARTINPFQVRLRVELRELQGTSDGEKVRALARYTPLDEKYEGLLEAALAGCL